MRLFVLAGLLIACASACGGAPAPTPPAAVPVAPAKPAPPAKVSFPGAPVSPAGDQLAWVLDAIVKRKGKLERAELEQHFDAKFLAEVPVPKVQEIFGQLGAQLAGLKITEVQGTASALVAQVAAGELKLRISLELDAKAQKIAGLNVRRDGGGGVALRSFGDALRAAGTLAPRAQLLVASLDRGTCKPLHELGGTDQLAIGSTFKLYVLLGLVDRILTGKAAWTDELAVRDAWKSLPSGVTQNEPPGTKHPLQRYAERMISISDNTAADHLLYHLGRRTVEAAVRASGHAQPARNAPFLSTRELFVLKLGAPAERTRYLALPEARRRDHLDRALAGKAPALDLAGAWKTARQIDQLEWFASAEDLCDLMGALWTRAQQPKGAPLLGVLAKNPGLPIDAKTWPYIGFKGGSEPGAINMTYLLKRNDDQWFVVTLGFNADEGGTLEDQKIYDLAVAVIDLLGRAR